MVNVNKYRAVCIAIVLLLNSIVVRAELSGFNIGGDFSDPEKVRMLIDYMYNSIESNTFNSEEYLNETKSLLSIVKEDSLINVLYTLKGRLHHLRGEYPSAYSAYQTALNNYKANNDQYGVATSYRNLGETYRAAMIYKSSISYLESARKIFNELKDSLMIASTHNRLAAVFFEMFDFKKTKLHVELSNQFTPPDSKGASLKANNYNILGAMFTKSSPDSALNYFRKALSLADSFNFVVVKPNVYINMSVVYFELKEYEKALNSAMMAYQIAKDNNINSYIAYATRMVASSHYELKNYKEAYEYYLISSAIRDSLINERKNQQLLEAESKYQSQKKEEEIKNQKSLRFYQGLGLGSILLILLLVALHFVSRNKSLQRINKELEDKNNLITDQHDKLAELNATKDKFFSIIAHDLKNPLTSVKLIAESIKSNYDQIEDEEKIELVSDIYSSTDGIFKLLDNLLTWARSQTGKIKYNPIATYPKYLVDNAISLFSSALDKKSIKVINLVENFTIIADANMLSTVFRNIIGNAVKFTPNGGSITISNLHIIYDGLPYQRISISDTGVGIPDARVRNLFKIDKAQSTPGTDNEKGTGLGLIICREFIDLHSGKIWAESTIGKGTTIHIALPWEREA